MFMLGACPWGVEGADVPCGFIHIGSLMLAVLLHTAEGLNVGPLILTLPPLWVLIWWLPRGSRTPPGPVGNWAVGSHC